MEEYHRNLDGPKIIVRHPESTYPITIARHSIRGNFSPFCPQIAVIGFMGYLRDIGNMWNMRRIRFISSLGMTD